MSISRKIMASLVGIALLAILLLGGLSLIGFLNIRSTFTAGNAAAIEKLHQENAKVMTANIAGMATSLSGFISQSLNVDISRIMGELYTLKGGIEVLYNSGGTDQPNSIARHEEYIVSQAASISETEIAETVHVFGGATGMFDNALKVEPYISLAYLALENGVVISSTDTFYPEVENADMRTRDWYKDTIASDVINWSDLYTGSDGRAYVTCSVAITGADGTRLGVLAFDLRVSEISDKIFRFESDSYISAFILNRTGSVLLSSLGVEETLQIDGIRQSIENIDFTMQESTHYLGEGIIIGYSPVESTGWIMGAVLNYEQLMRPVDLVSESVTKTGQELDAVIQNTFSWALAGFAAVVAVLLVLVPLISWYSSKSIVRPVKILTEGAAIIGKGNMDYVLPDLGADEIGRLAVSFSDMTRQLKVYINQVAKNAAEQQRLESELDLARNIQLGMLPAEITCPGYDIAGMMLPAREVGGDFYDFFLLGEDRETLCLVAADVAGKGVGAALFMTMAKVIIKTAALQGVRSPSEILEMANNLLCGDNPAELFVTAFCAMVDRKTGHIRYANAAHNSPVITDADGVAAFLPVKPRLPLAAMEGTKYPEYEADLPPGGTLLLYTDGVTEATNAEEKLYGDNRLLARCKGLRGLRAKEAVAGLKADVDAFVLDAPQFDDITIVAVRQEKA